MTVQFKDEAKAAFLVVIAEALFVILPLLVLSLNSAFRGASALDVLSSAEWSFAAAIMMGQAIVKFVSGAASLRDETFWWQATACIVAAIIVLGLVPSLVVPMLVLTRTTPSTSLAALQMVIFVVSLALFILFGSLGHTLIESGTKRVRPTSAI